MSRVGLTGRQAELLAFIQSETEAGRPAPSFGEMGRHLGLASRSSIHRLVTALEERGYIVRMPNRARAIGLVGEGQPPRTPLAPSSSRGVRFGLPISVAERLVNYCDRRRVAYRDVLAAALDDYMDRHQ